MSAEPLEKFIKKYQTAKSYNSKEIRLTIAEAEELSTAIALVISQKSTLSEKIIDLQEKLLEAPQDLSISGGKF